MLHAVRIELFAVHKFVDTFDRDACLHTMWNELISPQSFLVISYYKISDYYYSNIIVEQVVNY